MHPDLVHAPRPWLAEDDGGGAVVGESLELSLAVFARVGNLADTDLVAHHFDGLDALHHPAGGTGELMQCLAWHDVAVAGHKADVM